MRLRTAVLAALAALAAFALPAPASGPAIGGVTDNGPVPRYGKLEVTFTLGTAYANPYDPAQIDAQVVFSGPGGVTRTVSAFWYQAFTRSGGTGGQTLTATGSPPLPSRVRGSTQTMLYE